MKVCLIINRYNNFFIEKKLFADIKTFKLLDNIKRLNAKNF